MLIDNINLKINFDSTHKKKERKEKKKKYPHTEKRKNQAIQKTKVSSLLTLHNLTSSPARIFNWAEMAEMTETEFRIWIGMKIIDIQEKVGTQSKKSKKYNYMNNNLLLNDF